MAVRGRLGHRLAMGGITVSLVCPLVLAGPGADAQTRTIRDRVGDERKHIDIRTVTVTHGRKSVKATIRGRHGKAGFTKRAVDYAYLQVADGHGGRYVLSGVPGGRRFVTHFDADGSPDSVSCPKLRVRFAFKRSRIRISAPRSCVGRPATGRGEVHVQSGRFGEYDDRAAWKRPVRRG